MQHHIRSFQSHRSSARGRGIDFDLTFEQWLAIWGDKIDQRGRGADQLGMLRIRDEGGYSVGNVYIGTPQQNHQERSVALRVRRSQVPASPSGGVSFGYQSSSWTNRNAVFDEYTEDDEDEEYA